MTQRAGATRLSGHALEGSTGVRGFDPHGPGEQSDLHLLDARTRSEHLGATGRQERSEDLLRRRGRRWWRGSPSRTTDGAGLAEREAEPLRELRAGPANAEIAQRMVPGTPLPGT